VYTIYFNAIDAQGETCSGSVKVAAPLKRKVQAVDSGQAYDSLQP
jgi:hypothetical protein